MGLLGNTMLLYVLVIGLGLGAGSAAGSFPRPGFSGERSPARRSALIFWLLLAVAALLAALPSLGELLRGVGAVPEDHQGPRPDAWANLRSFAVMVGVYLAAFGLAFRRVRRGTDPGREAPGGLGL